jgi:hypothetical protein
VATYLIENDNPEHGRRISETISRPFIPGLDRCLARTRDGELLGGVIYQDHFPPTSICIHVASWDPRWLSRDFLWAIFDYPFNVIGVDNVIGLVNETQPDVLAFDLKIGFEERYRLPGIVPGGDLIVLYMERGKCRWLVDEAGHPYKPRALRAGYL